MFLSHIDRIHRRILQSVGYIMIATCIYIIHIGGAVTETGVFAATTPAYLPSQIDAAITQALSSFPVETQIQKMTSARTRIGARMLRNPDQTTFETLDMINKSITRLISRYILDTYVDSQTPKELELVAQMHTIGNQRRTRKGLPPLIRNQKLAKSAEYMADDMAQYDYFVHENPFGIGYVNRMKAFEYDFTYVSENLGQGKVDPETIVMLRDSSPIHNKNMYHPDATEVGYGYDPVLHYWVAVYGSQG